MGIKISFYQGTRHSSATEAVNRTKLDLMRQFLGHPRQAMIQKYARMNPEGLRPVLRKDKMDACESPASRDKGRS